MSFCENQKVFAVSLECHDSSDKQTIQHEFAGCNAAAQTSKLPPCSSAARCLHALPFCDACLAKLPALCLPVVSSSRVVDSPMDMQEMALPSSMPKVGIRYCPFQRGEGWMTMSMLYTMTKDPELPSAIRV